MPLAMQEGVLIGKWRNLFSNEINKLAELEAIARPKNFKLLYSIYHPILNSWSSRTMFLSTKSVGCEKPRIR